MEQKIPQKSLEDRVGLGDPSLLRESLGDSKRSLRSLRIEQKIPPEYSEHGADDPSEVTEDGAENPLGLGVS